MWWRYIFIYRDRQHTSNIFIAEEIQNDNNFHKNVRFTWNEGFFEYIKWESLGFYLQDYGIIYYELSVRKKVITTLSSLLLCFGVYTLIEFANFIEIYDFMRSLKDIENIAINFSHNKLLIRSTSALCTNSLQNSQFLQNIFVQ